MPNNNEFMFAQMTKDAVANRWDSLRDMIKQSLYEEEPEKFLAALFESVVAGKAQIWAGAAVVDGKIQLCFLAVTCFSYDYYNEQRNLYINSLIVSDHVKTEWWAEALIALRLFAKAERCAVIQAHSNVATIVSLAKKFGADTSRTLIRWRT